MDEDDVIDLGGYFASDLVTPTIFPEITEESETFEDAGFDFSDIAGDDYHYHIGYGT